MHSGWCDWDACAIITTTGSTLGPEIDEHLSNVGVKQSFNQSQYKIYQFPKIRPGTGSNHGGDEYTLWNVLTKCHNADPVSVDISKSHLKVIQDAYTRGCETLIVFEDDARFTQPLDLHKLIRIRKWLRKNMNDWDIFYYGCFVHPPLLNTNVTPDIDFTLFPMGSHAYVINRSGMLKVLAKAKQITQDHIPIDSFYRNNFDFRKYMAYPSLNNQITPPAMYTKTARKLGVNHLITFEQCCLLFEWFSHYSKRLLGFIALLLLAFIIWFMT